MQRGRKINRTKIREQLLRKAKCINNHLSDYLETLPNVKLLAYIHPDEREEMAGLLGIKIDMSRWINHKLME